MGYKFNPFTSTLDIVGGGGGSGDTYLTTNYSSVAAPQLFNPDASAVSSGTDNYTLSSNNPVAFVSLNGQVLDDSEYSLIGSTLTVTPDVGFTAVTDEVLVFQTTFASASTGGVINSFVQKAADYTVLVSDYYIECTANSFTLTLPTAVGVGGRTFVIKNSSTGTIIVDGSGSETIDGALTANLSTQYESITVASNGADWVIV
jgi:hypothetical protein